MSLIVDNPAELAAWRRKLFELGAEELALPLADWEALWPYIDNFWVERNACRGKETQQFNCRIWRNDSSKKTGEGKRNRQKRNVEPCGMKMYVKKKDGFVLVARYPGRNKETTCHNHDLEYMDKIKTPSAVMKIAAEQVALGKTPSEAVVELKGQEIVRALEEAGGLHINNNRVRNAYKAYKQQTNNGTLALRAANTSTPREPLGAPRPVSLAVACQCGAVHFEAPAPYPLDLYHCHCLECRKQSASAFGTSAIFPAQALFPLSLELVEKLSCYTRPTKSGGTMDCYFCAQCGVRVFHRSRNPDGIERPTVSVKGGCIDGLDWSQAKHIYTRSAVVPIPHGVEQWRASPEPVAPLPSGSPMQQNPSKEQLILPDFPEHAFT
jgi:hypothetical protein